MTLASALFALSFNTASAQVPPPGSETCESGAVWFDGACHRFRYFEPRAVGSLTRVDGNGRSASAKGVILHEEPAADQMRAVVVSPVPAGAFADRGGFAVDRIFKLSSYDNSSDQRVVEYDTAIPGAVGTGALNHGTLTVVTDRDLEVCRSNGCYTVQPAAVRFGSSSDGMSACEKMATYAEQHVLGECAGTTVSGPLGAVTLLPTTSYETTSFIGDATHGAHGSLGSPSTSCDPYGDEAYIQVFTACDLYDDGTGNSPPGNLDPNPRTIAVEWIDGPCTNWITEEIHGTEIRTEEGTEDFEVIGYTVSLFGCDEDGDGHVD